MKTKYFLFLLFFLFLYLPINYSMQLPYHTIRKDHAFQETMQICDKEIHDIYLEDLKNVKRILHKNIYIRATSVERSNDLNSVPVSDVIFEKDIPILIFILTENNTNQKTITLIDNILVSFGDTSLPCLEVTRVNPFLTIETSQILQKIENHILITRSK